MESVMTKVGALQTQDTIHKISIKQIKLLKDLNDQNEVYEEYMYIKPKIQDYFYMQTGLEIDEFNANVLRLNLQADPDYV